MNKIDIALVYKQCRTCLSETCNTKMLDDTISICGAVVTISKIIMECASVEIINEDALPNIICSLCVQYASTSYQFRKKCEESDKILRMRMIKSEIEIEDVLSIVTDVTTSHNVKETPFYNITNKKINTNTTINHNHKLNKTGTNFISDSHSNDYFDGDINYMDNMPLIMLKKEIDAMPDDVKLSFLLHSKNDLKTTPDSIYNCSRCHTVFQKETHLRYHLCLKYGKRRKCVECGRKFHNLSELREHYATHETFTCKKCVRSFDSLLKLKKHLKRDCFNRVDYKKTCAVCQTEFKSFKKLQEHLKSHEKNTCMHCKKIFPKLLGLQQHLQRFHIQKLNNRPVEKKRCRVCQMEFDNADQLRGHYTTHDSFPCTNCVKVFRSISSLRSHQHRACINSDKKACMVCNSQFFTHYQLLKHYATDHENYPCTMCGETFEKVLDLRIHKQRKCRISQSVNKCAQCDLEFQSTDLLLQHHTTHSSIQCPDCGREFKAMRDLSLHRTNRCQINKQSLVHGKRSASQRCEYCRLAVVAAAERKDTAKLGEVINGIGMHDVDAMKKHVVEHEMEGLRCNQCESIFNSISSWRDHLATHATHNCPECTQFFENSNSLQTHMLRHDFDSIQQSKSTQCRECELSFEDRDLLFEHYVTHASFSCPICEKTFDGLPEMKGHYMQETCHKPKLPRTCDICHKVFRRAYAMRLHRLTHNSNVLCPHCDFQAERRPDLYKHMDAEHANLKTIQCPDCDKRFFKKTNLMVHKLVHTGEKKHICDYCGVGFALGNNLKAHIRIHTGERPYKCKVCDKTFVQHRSMVSHMDMHLPRQKHVCPICGKTYPRKQAMKLHMKRHNEDRPFACTMCTKTFQTKLDLKRHTDTHSGIRNHICGVCNKAFGRKNALNVHMMIHTGETPHVCDICGKGFIQAHCLRGHMKTHHGRV